MSKYKRVNRPIGKDRHITVRSQRRAKPDLEAIAQVIVDLAIAKAEEDLYRMDSTSTVSKHGKV